MYDAMGRIEGAYSLGSPLPPSSSLPGIPTASVPSAWGNSRRKTVFASESCALDAVGARFLRDIRPGEIVTVSYDGVKSDTRRCGT